MNNPSMNEGNSADRIYATFIEVMADVMLVVTAGHEQVGAVEACVQDASFCAFKWVPGALIGTKQTAIAQGLIMSGTSTPMPKLLGDDWTHLFPESKKYKNPAGKTPKQAFATFQEELRSMSIAIKDFNKAATTRPFPDIFPIQTLDPANLETSISV